jgi:hypothetical protein
LCCLLITSPVFTGEFYSAEVFPSHNGLRSYNLRYQDPSVITIAIHRAVAVIIGVLWAFVVSQFWWPASARHELGKSLSE